MTSKRYHKLFAAYMTQIVKGNKGAGKCIRAARNAVPNFKEEFPGGYQQAWNSLCEHCVNPEYYSVIAQALEKSVK